MQYPPEVATVLERLQRTRWRYYNLHPVSGEVLGLLARVTQARRVVEVGTANGYSAIVLGEVVRTHGGTVVTIERDGALAEEAKANIVEAGLQEVVTVVPGSAYKVLKELAGPWDFAFLDATKQEYLGYLERLLPKLAPRALLVADNLLSHADELAEFRARAEMDPRLTAAILPVGTGLLVGLFESVPEPRGEGGAHGHALRDVTKAVAPVVERAQGTGR